MLSQSIVSYIAAETIPAGARVKFVSGSSNRVELADSTDNDIGTALLYSGKSSYAAESAVGVALNNHPGTRTLLTDASAIAAGELVYKANDGKVAHTGTDIYGVALDANGSESVNIEGMHNPQGADATPGDGSVTAAKLAPDAVETLKILDLNVTTGKLAANAVTTAKITDANVTPAKTNIVQAVTATSTGATTGTILDTTTHATVTSDSADKIVILPAPTPGRMLVISVGATGFELRSSAPATVAINGGTDTAAESAIAANSTILAICISATAWKAIFLDADSDVAKVEAAAN